MPDPLDSEPGDSDPLSGAWRHLQRHWHQDEAHRAFLALAVELDRMREAGALYREVRESDPARRAEAERRIGQLIGQAMVLLQAIATPPRDARRARRILLAAAVLLSLVLFGAAAYGLLRMS